MRFSDWSSDVCSSDLAVVWRQLAGRRSGADLSGDLLQRHSFGLRRHHRGAGTQDRGSVHVYGRSAAARRGVRQSADVSGRCLSGMERSAQQRSEEHTSELQSLMRNSYAVFCLKKKNRRQYHTKQDKKVEKRKTTA